MAFFNATSSTTQYLNAPPAPKRFNPNRPRDELDDFLSSDLELSFASTMSLNSPPHAPISLAPDSPQPMDISPAPAAPSLRKPTTRPRAFTSAARMFGRDLANNAPTPPTLNVPPAPKSGSGSTSQKRTQRAALPSEWLSFPRPSEAREKGHKENMFDAPQDQPSYDAMDVDDSFTPGSAPSVNFSPAPLSAAPTITGFNHLFYETMSPTRYADDSPIGPQPKKRRSLSPEHVSHIEQEDVSSSPAPPSSPSARKFERRSSGPLLQFSKPTLQGLGMPTAANKRSRRPALSAMVHPSDSGSGSSYSAHPDASGESNTADLLHPVMPPTRRAFSAMLPPTGFHHEPSSDESSFDGPDMSSPAQAYAKRQQVKTIRRCDGTDDFRPLTGATAMTMKDSPGSKSVSKGLPGFGDNEAHGKILPCHRVREDGLMRINSQTLDKLLDGAFDSKIANYHVIDCRFDYEYNGGHIPGAVNMNTTAAIEEFLLGSSLAKPRPSTSSEPSKKTVLVFHCEYSVKRAPTFAKHLRSKDRALNNHVYPRVHYPEVYILEGGYCQYFKDSAPRCQPSAYVPMDDPTYASSRREDLDQFRKGRFGRTKSYAYGELEGKMAATQQQQPKRNTAPSGGSNPLFAAANAARTRRGGNGGNLMTLAEDGNSTAHSDDEDTDIGDSPCPPPTKAAAFKGKKMGRAPLTRAETYGPTRMAY
ncbi:hypothetical protein PLICRDRAFT_108846 [Plicaturopsis crispa FD-325 SS-3]|nr:hypothetical protein PLICRDRAFT_108846 [Plicaturopsis crispa FD-325 SS-3]